MRIRMISFAATTVAAMLVLTACGQSNDSDGMEGMDHGSSASPSSPEASGEVFNAADEMFATMMIPHHQQAVDMADMLLSKGDIAPDVVALAEQIKGAQAPEIETMVGWLEEWGVPYDESADMGSMDHGGGMMSDEDMAALESASGVDATRIFLEGMTVHHEGAIEMAQVELDNGFNPDALELAQLVIDGQTSELETMEGMLGSL